MNSTQSSNRKVLVKIWAPLLLALEKKANGLCLRRDAFLNKLLKVELDRLEAEIQFPNSETARTFIAEQLDLLKPRTAVSIALESSTIDRLNRICESKRMVRDSFFNRLFFFLVASRKLLELLFELNAVEAFENNSSLPTGVALSGLDAASDILDDPFQYIRACLMADPELADTAFYQLYFDRNALHIGNQYSDIESFIGLNCYLNDTLLPSSKKAQTGISHQSAGIFDKNFLDELHFQSEKEKQP